MDNQIQFFPDGYSPRPPDEVEIELVETAVYPDRFRVFVHIVVTPFQQRPNLIMTTRDANNNIVAELNIIETMHHDMEFTMHLRSREHDPAGEYTLTIELFYETRNPPRSTHVESFVVPEMGA